MKKLSNLFFILMVLAAAISLPSCKHDGGQDEIPAILALKKPIGTPEENALLTTTYNKAVTALKNKPDDLKQYITLATVFINEGRLTGNGNYYSSAAVKMLNKVISSTTADKDQMFQAYSLKSAVLLNMHQFKDALDMAQKGVVLGQGNSGIFGALVDANVELGNYDEAVKDCDQMLALRPDLRSYSRASYIRQIFGQNRSAINAMTMAVQAGMPGAESTEWARVNLGDLYLNMGNPDSASIEYRTALVYRPNYAFAEMGLARVACAHRNYDEAIAHSRAAIGIMSEAAFVSYMGEMYALKGDTNKAKEVRNDVIKLMEDGQKDEAADALVKHNISREMAMAYMNAGNLDKALSYAQTDLQMRPDNIDANNLIAWIYYRKGDYQNAKVHADKMLHTHTKNATSLYEAGLIYAAAGDTATGDTYKQQAQALNPYIDPTILNAGKPAMATNKS